MERYKVEMAKNSCLFPWDTAESRGERLSDTTFPFWFCKYTYPVHAHQLMSIFWQKWKHCLIFVRFESAMHFLGPKCSSDIARNAYIAGTGAEPKASPPLPCHWHTWWHLMISCLNSDVLEKRLEYPGGCRGGECVNRHGVFGKSKPLVAALCLQSTWLQHVPKMGGSGTNRSNPDEGWERGGCSTASRGPATAAAIKCWSNIVLGAACPSHVRYLVGQIPWNKPRTFQWGSESQVLGNNCWLALDNCFLGEVWKTSMSQSCFWKATSCQQRGFLTLFLQRTSRYESWNVQATLV